MTVTEPTPEGQGAEPDSRQGARAGRVAQPGQPVSPPPALPTGPDGTALDVTSVAPLGWRITIVCSMVALLETIATGMVGGALTDIQDTFGLNDTLAGLIPTAVVVGSLLAAVPSAHLADRTRRTYVLAGIALLWTLVIVGSAWAPVFAVFLGSRMVLGVAAQLNNPAASSLIADAHPARARAKAYGYERMANYLGLPLGIALGAALASALGWRVAFTVLAIPGALAAGAAFLLKEPPRGLGDLLDRRGRDLAGSDPATQEQTAAVSAATEATEAADATDAADATEGGDQGEAAEGAAAADAADDELRVPTLGQLRTLWAIPTMRVLLVGVPVMFSALASLFFWSTKFFQDVGGLDESGAGGIAGGVGGTAIVVGIIVGGRLGDRHHGARPGWRLVLAGNGLLLGAAAFAGMVALPGVAAQATMFGIANIGISIAVPNLTAAVADVVPAGIRGMAFSAVQFLIAAGGALGPPIVGATSDAVGSLRPAMAVLVLPLVFGGVWVRRGAKGFDADVDQVLDSVSTTAAPG